MDCPCCSEPMLGAWVLPFNTEMWLHIQTRDIYEPPQQDPEIAICKQCQLVLFDYSEKA